MGLAVIMGLYFVISSGKLITSNVYLKRANKFSKLKQYSKSINYYNRIFSIAPVELCPQTDVAQFYYAAEAYREAGDIKTANSLYKKDLALNPYCPEVNNMLGATSGQLGDIDSAVKYLETAVFTAPHYKAAYKNLATAYIAKKEYENTIKILEKYMLLNGADDEFSRLITEAKRLGKM